MEPAFQDNREFRIFALLAHRCSPIDGTLGPLQAGAIDGTANLHTVSGCGQSFRKGEDESVATAANSSLSKIPAIEIGERLPHASRPFAGCAGFDQHTAAMAGNHIMLVSAVADAVVEVGRGHLVEAVDLDVVANAEIFDGIGPHVAHAEFQRGIASGIKGDGAGAGRMR